YRAWTLSRPCDARQRAGGPHSRWRRSLLLRLVHQTNARCHVPSSSRRDRCVLYHRSALVRPLRPSQSRLLPCLHHRTQLQALPHSRISAHPTVLVLRRGSASRISSMAARSGLRRNHGRFSASLALVQPGDNPPSLVVALLHSLLHHLAFEIARLHPARDSTSWNHSCSRLHAPGAFENSAPHRG